MSLRPPHRSVAPLRAAIAFAVTLALPAAVPARAADAVPVPADRAAAEALTAQAPSKDRDRALARWAREASLGDLMYLLRLPPARFGDAEGEMLRAALKLVPESRAALHARLAAREARSRGRDLADGPAHLGASVFRAAAMLPDSGDFGAFGHSVRVGVTFGIDAARRLEDAGEQEAARALLGGAAIAPPIALDSIATGDDPRTMLAAFDASVAETGAFVGELLSVPTLILGTAARYAGVPLVSPTATDENTGALAPVVFQVGPSGTGRAEALARATVTEGRHVGVLVSSAFEDGFFSRAFPEAVLRHGGLYVWREVYPAGNADFRELVRAMRASGVELLFWEGEAREAEALLRQMSRDHVSVAVCGGPALDPDQHHAEVRLLLEGVTFAGEEWRVREPLAGALERAGFFAGTETDQQRNLRLRGFLAGHALRSAVEQGALCPEETVERLRARILQESSGFGFLDFGPIVEIPVMRVERGEAVAVQ